MPLQLYDREKILESCLSIFARHGYKNTSTELLAESAGISKALIFHHFKSKKKLYFTLLEYCFEKIKTELPVSDVLEYHDLFEAIEQIGQIKLNYYRKHPDEYKLVCEVFYATPVDLKKDIEEKYGHVIASKDKMWEQLFEKVPLREGVNRKQAFELIMVIAKHFENKFLTEIIDIDAIDDEHAQNLIDEMNRFYNMVCYGISEKRGK